MPITYKQAGVDIDAGDSLIDRISPLAKATRTAHVLSDVGGFAGLCGLPPGLKDPVLVSGTDGVGTKLKLAFATGIHDTIGIDLVAMCVNDIVTTGAVPLFFLDYFGTGKLDVGVAEAVIAGIAEGCKLSGCALLGGETAELPGMYAAGEYDLAGFAVGVVERSKILDGRRVRPGDLLVAAGSNGLHSNGYSLARKVLEDQSRFPLGGFSNELGMTFAEALLKPTEIYSRAVQELAVSCGEELHALAHITGGGMPGNIPRVLPDGLGARIHLSSYTPPPIFGLIQREGPVDPDEMHRTFNLGVGLIAVVASEQAKTAIAAIKKAGHPAWVLGEVIESGDVAFENRVQLVR